MTWGFDCQIRQTKLPSAYPTNVVLTRLSSSYITLGGLGDSCLKVCQSKVKDAGCTGDDITFVSLCDFNVPNCRASSSIDALTERIAAVNNTAPERNVGLAIFPDLPKDSSLRGLYDEEKALQEAFFALRQHCDTRFIELLLVLIERNSVQLVSVSLTCLPFPSPLSCFCPC